MISENNRIMKKILTLLFFCVPLIASAQIGRIGSPVSSSVSPGDSSYSSVDVDTLYLAKDSIYVAASGDTLLLVSDTTRVSGVLNVGANTAITGTTTTTDAIISNTASSNTLVLTPTATGQVDTLETTDLATAAITVTGLWTFDNAVIDSADIDTANIDYLYASGTSLCDNVVIDSADIDTADVNYLYISGTANLQNGATIDNSETDTLILTETVTKVAGELAVTGQADVGGLLEVTGTITGKTLVCLHTDPAIIFSDLDSCKNVAHFNNDADVIDFTLPGAEAGLIMMFYDIGGGVITVDPVDGTDTIYLNGTSVGAGDAIDSPGAVGDFICLMAIDATRWVTVGRSGVWIDGGAV